MAAQHINGITAVATPDSFPTDPYPRLLETQANWICLVPYAYSRLGMTQVWFDKEQWWGETPKGVEQNVKLAKKNKLKVFLKPQIYIPGSWPGDFGFETEEEWIKWEADYRHYIMTFLDIAIAYDVEMFCIGTEFKRSVIERSDFWIKLISDIRCIYTGQLTYSSNWDHFRQIGFWNDLDYIGISAYFPLSDKKQPSIKTLKKAWTNKIQMLKQFNEDINRPILFTEYGYLSVDGCAGKTWELEKRVKELPINEQAQATAFGALYSQLWQEDFWAGGFIWKWFPHGKGHEGYIPRDYTPQDKLAEEVITSWFTKDSIPQITE